MDIGARVPLHDPKRQIVAQESEIPAAIKKVLHAGCFVMGTEHDAFEQEFATYCGARHCTAVANGTDALEIALRAVGCDDHKEVITAANAGGYTTTACFQIGALPVYVDVRAEDLTIDPRAAVQAVTEKTGAIVATHLYGHIADVSTIRTLLAGRRIPIVEDCAQAHGALSAGKRAGTLGDIGTFSFYPTKNLGAFGDAGAIVTNVDAFAARARRLRQYGWERKYEASVPLGRNSRMDELQAAVLRVKLPHLDTWNQKRRRIVARYKDATAHAGIEIVNSCGENDVAHLCVARHPRRDEIRASLDRAGVDTAIHYPILDHEQRGLRSLPRRTHDLPNSVKAVREIWTLPCFPELTDRELMRVCGALRKCI